MKKTPLYLILLLALPAVLAQECQYSEPDVTKDITFYENGMPLSYDALTLSDFKCHNPTGSKTLSLLHSFRVNNNYYSKIDVTVTFINSGVADSQYISIDPQGYQTVTRPGTNENSIKKSTINFVINSPAQLTTSNSNEPHPTCTTGGGEFIGAPYCQGNEIYQAWKLCTGDISQKIIKRCTNRQKCVDGQCVVSCSDKHECEPGIKTCEGNSHKTCTLAEDGCYRWSIKTECLPSELCVEGTCQPKISSGTTANAPSIQIKRTNPGIAGVKPAEIIFDVVNTDLNAKVEGFLLCKSPDDATISSSLGIGSGSGAQYFSPKFTMDQGPSQKSITLTLESSRPGDRRVDCSIKYAPYKEQTANAEPIRAYFKTDGTITTKIEDAARELRLDKTVAFEKAPLCGNGIIEEDETTTTCCEDTINTNYFTLRPLVDSCKDNVPAQTLNLPLIALVIIGILLALKYATSFGDKRRHQESLRRQAEADKHIKKLELEIKKAEKHVELDKKLLEKLKTEHAAREELELIKERIKESTAEIATLHTTHAQEREKLEKERLTPFLNKQGHRVIINEDGYQQFAKNILYPHKQGKLFHRWYAKKHIYTPNRDKYPLPWEEYDVDHKDGNKRNNDLSNLQILTREEHKRKHNLRQ
ncbi:hypothetical protein C4580_02000 [Candidatus Woesearchaeota archaeon]|nr:MAG: hypothetical protein C4580_02000 [Candidatus Woesearchaeota archaeon]